MANPLPEVFHFWPGSSRRPRAFGVLFVLAKSQPGRQAGRHPAHHPLDDARDYNMRGMLQKPLSPKWTLFSFF